MTQAAQGFKPIQRYLLGMDLQVETGEPIDIIDITDDLEATLESLPDHGLVSVSVHHTTAGIVVNEAEARLLDDLADWLDRVVDTDTTYRHDRIDDNARAHLQASLLGSTASLPIHDGRIDRGTWQRLLLVDCDGPRTRRLSVTVIPGA